MDFRQEIFIHSFKYFLFETRKWYDPLNQRSKTIGQLDKCRAMHVRNLKGSLTVDWITGKLYNPFLIKQPPRTSYLQHNQKVARNKKFPILPQQDLISMTCIRNAGSRQLNKWSVLAVLRSYFPSSHLAKRNTILRSRHSLVPEYEHR